MSDGSYMLLLVLVGVAFLLQFDTVIEDLKRRKGGDRPSEEEGSPPKKPDDWRV